MILDYQRSISEGFLACVGFLGYAERAFAQEEMDTHLEFLRTVNGEGLASGERCPWALGGREP